MPGHCIPTGLADPQRLIFYGGTEPETRAGEKSVTFFAYDPAARKLLWSGFGRSWLGRLPGDLHYTRGNFSFYFPLVTCLILSLVLTLLLWLFRK